MIADAEVDSLLFKNIRIKHKLAIRVWKLSVNLLLSFIKSDILAGILDSDTLQLDLGERFHPSPWTLVAAWGQVSIFIKALRVIIVRDEVSTPVCWHSVLLHQYAVD